MRTLIVLTLAVLLFVSIETHSSRWWWRTPGRQGFSCTQTSDSPANPSSSVLATEERLPITNCNFWKRNNGCFRFQQCYRSGDCICDDSLCGNHCNFVCTQQTIDGYCVECINDSQCGGDTPVCDTVTNSCVDDKCSSDADCNEDGFPACVGEECVECKDDTNCEDNTANGKINCDTDSNTCEICFDGADCEALSGSLNACVENQCKECDIAGSSQCDFDPAREFCDVGSNECKACVADNDCPDFNTPGATDKTCSDEFTCVDCEADADCDDAALPNCDTQNNVCLECVDDDDCPNGASNTQEGLCNPDSDECVECLADTDCGPEQSCDLTSGSATEFQCLCDSDKCLDANTICDGAVPGACDVGVECKADGQCRLGQTCDTTNLVCTCQDALASDPCQVAGGSCFEGECIIDQGCTPVTSDQCADDHVCLDSAGTDVCYSTAIRCRADSGEEIFEEEGGNQVSVCPDSFECPPLLEPSTVFNPYCVPVCSFDVCQNYDCPSGFDLVSGCAFNAAGDGQICWCVPTPSQ